MKFEYSIIQIILILISCYFLGIRLIKFVKKERTQTVFKVLMTLFVWGGVLFTSLFPQTVHSLSRSLGFGENLNTLIFFGFVVVFVILFRLITTIENHERQLTELVRKEAINEFINSHK